MPSVSLDDLFGGGADLGDDVLIKARLRVHVRPPADPAVRSAVDHAVALYASRVDDLVAEINSVISGVAGGRASISKELMLKAGERQPFRPGSRGGTWYRDSRGNIRYGVPPEGKFTGNAPQDQPPVPPLDHLRPGSFLGGFGRDRDLTDFMIEHPDQHDLTDNQLKFLGAWYGTADGGGGLLDAFLACAGITRADLKYVADLRFGNGKVSYEEAVFEFFAAQGPLFMGSDIAVPEDEEAWHKILNDEIKPLLDDVFVKYESAKSSDDLQRMFSEEPARQRRRFLTQARRCRSEVDEFSDVALGDWKPVRVVDAAMDGLHAMGLVMRRSRAARRSMVHGRPHLREALMIDGRVLDDASEAPLLPRGALDSLTSSQVMLVYLAGELHRRWDQYTRSFSEVPHELSPAGALGEAALTVLADKDERWGDALPAVRTRLGMIVDGIVHRLNMLNSLEGYPDEVDTK